ncbi:MAG: MbnP family protein [Luteolibacter sp.]
MRGLGTYFVGIIALLVAETAAFGSTLEISVNPTFNGDPLFLDSLRYQNAVGETLSVTRLSYLLSGFALERADGTWAEFPKQYAWVDAEARRTMIRFDEVPAGVYRSIRFHVGPDAEANAADPAEFPAEHALNPNLDGLHWSWQGGYIFLALEGRFRSSNGEPSGYAYHFARDPNRTRISLLADLDLTHDCALQLDFDIATLLNAPRPLSFVKDGTATHSREGDPILAGLLANLPAAFRVRQVLSAKPAISKPSPLKPLYLPEKYTPYRFTMSRSFPIPDLPRDNPLINERVALGKQLFSETALSRDGTLSCASCHTPDVAFNDARRFSVGVHGQIGTRNAMPLLNLAWKNRFFWDGRAPSLRAQALMPIQDHTEMDETLEQVTAKLAGKGGYSDQFNAAFGSTEISGEKIGLALEQYLLTLTSYDSKFDRAFQGRASLSADEQRGFELFMTEYEPRTGNFGADCFHCHGGALFGDQQFHNNGIALTNDPGRIKVTGLASDQGKFATPSLRNVALTGPYMHDGRFATLEDVIEHYSNRITQSPTLDPNLAKHPAAGLNLSASDKSALVQFLKTLTDKKFEKSTTSIEPPKP